MSTASSGLPPCRMRVATAARAAGGVGTTFYAWVVGSYAKSHETVLRSIPARRRLAAFVSPGALGRERSRMQKPPEVIGGFVKPGPSDTSIRRREGRQ